MPASWATLTPPSQRTPDRTLWWTLGLSVALHAALLTWRTAAPVSFNRVFENTPLDVILVNAQSDTAPGTPRALAQVRLDGGGEPPPGLKLSSAPLRPSPGLDAGVDITEMQRKIEALKTQQLQLLTQLQQELSRLSQDNQGDKLQGPDQTAREERKQLLARHLAQIEPHVNQTQHAPRKRYISPATREVVYAFYYDKLRRTIETLGTRNFPQIDGQKLYGQLTMVITLDHQGHLLQTEVTRSSGQPLLDQRAVAIVRSATPFDAFNPTMRRQADQIAVVTRFHFSRDLGLHTQMLANEPGKEH